MTVTLRGPQVEAIDAVRAAWKGGTTNALVVLPTGVGKTITALSVVAGAVAKGQRVLWLAHRQELLDQPMRAFRALWPDAARDAGIVQADRDEAHRQVVFGSIQTLRSDVRLARYLEKGPPNLAVIDEAHHSVANEWRKVLEALDAARAVVNKGPAYKLGLTATPDRADGKTLAKLWTLVYACSIIRAIGEGHLVPPVYASETLPLLNLANVAGEGDWDAEDLGEALMAAHVVEHTVGAIQKHAAGRRGIVFTATVAQARETSQALRDAGIESRFVCGETEDDERRRMLAGFQSGAIDWLCNAQVLTEGTDLPAADCIVMARPTRSKGLYTQCLGRGLRTNPSTGKENCLVIDLVAASDEHGKMPITAPILLADLEREERAKSEDTRKQSGGKGEVKPWRKGKPPEASWVRIGGLDRDAWAVDCGEHGRVVVVAAENGLWRAALVGGRTSNGKRVPDQALCESPIDFDLAQGLGEDVARRAAGLARKRAGWRTDPASEPQISMLLKFRHADGYPADAIGDLLGEWFGTPKPTKGMVGDALTAEFTKRDLHKRGLAARTDRRGAA